MSKYQTGYFRVDSNRGPLLSEATTLPLSPELVYSPKTFFELRCTFATFFVFHLGCIDVNGHLGNENERKINIFLLKMYLDVTK